MFFCIRVFSEKPIWAVPRTTLDSWSILIGLVLATYIDNYCHLYVYIYILYTYLWVFMITWMIMISSHFFTSPTFLPGYEHPREGLGQVYRSQAREEGMAHHWCTYYAFEWAISHMMWLPVVDGCIMAIYPKFILYHSLSFFVILYLSIYLAC